MLKVRETCTLGCPLVRRLAGIKEMKVKTITTVSYTHLRWENYCAGFVQFARGYSISWQSSFFRVVGLGYYVCLLYTSNSPYRDRSVEENLALFEKKRTGGIEEGQACLRANIDMA